jgi:hypothetical protein
MALLPARGGIAVDFCAQRDFHDHRFLPAHADLLLQFGNAMMAADMPVKRVFRTIVRDG